MFAYDLGAQPATEPATESAKPGVEICPAWKSTAPARKSLQHQQILNAIMKADMVGFSRGWHDLVKDVISGGS